MSALCLSVSITTAAQRIVFEKDVVDAGATMWKRPVTAVFKFSNKGRNPLQVTDVDAGCGCLKTEWSKESLSRGKHGEIRITYDAMQLGHFDRYIDVYTNADSQPTRIRMQALVDTVERQDLTISYPYSIDNILLNTNNVEFTDVYAGDSATAQIKILNNGTDVYTPTLMHLP
jgi:hypothetical protein